MAFELLSREKQYRFDFSATNLPLKAKRTNLFKAAPTLSFYELTNSSEVLFESAVSKIATTDPFWTLTSPLRLSQISPSFTLKVYQTNDAQKSQRTLVATAVIQIEKILGPEKETIFEVEGSTDGKTLILLDRYQEIE